MVFEQDRKSEDCSKFIAHDGCTIMECHVDAKEGLEEQER
ncbi:hypothetical protein BACCIP111895_02281 [Neobacillus rhizosphaerae]|uniref:Uncharacterized protein n=1 Tax=Neobacillus rhizosphaerae TaxID=2880965 RepID=A0ABN8KRF6_9BACI|nr:hypothetical protein BACCIP111895_02281 [Neobacillus rhizosphaerae]